ncbi:hypothetical protein ACFOEQ_08475 [Chryseobacterium arachidis]|uniref:hypothetical protein n=1 Tax=Chryseobacterium arachidis TaxID=1416778 RepID=UPI00360CDCE7
MMNKDLGFKGDQVVQIDFKKTNWEKNYNSKKYQLLKNEIAKIQGVEDITGSISSIGRGSANRSVAKDARDSTKIVESTGLGAIDEIIFAFTKYSFCPEEI